MKSDKPDPLAAFRRKPSEAGSTPAHDAETYAAFAAKDRVERLNIHRANDPTRSPRYLLLQDISYDRIFGLNFVLFFEHMTVAVRGKNLLPVISALQNGTADFIRQYNPEEWPDKPLAENAPLIESIEIILRGEQGAFAPAKKDAKH